MDKEVLKRSLLKFAAVLLIIYVGIKFYDKPTENKTTKTLPSIVVNKEPVSAPNRFPKKIIFSKHAKCRMECRQIDSIEVDDILRTGKINFKKSDTTTTQICKKRYALEGQTRDNQNVRIIIAPCEDKLTVITVIDLDTDWSCNCR
ncbi:hypothetical protein Pedsa_3157 [Pseudopedobacter saltans DSM 12145]|uniref:DUF4258 domain-containing protein n=1 Tax=Pseudopedobacter saltans (strain ATCC 51119 / DSM 12145 / JCM 21818 / CCUG 39354 / LMG 10337 / NBRC 100064 / NCIMB 13643) TaxID=762903 RepID=F0SAS2_PSESL|nr:DUF4258 domain-containing protein [Pseudopedobacter saltans]ADY53693.1 hypothetical protein Pedsa_3157 [Pseudopedobacter saltans DSM 12145]